MDIRETQNRIGRAATYGREEGGSRFKTAEQLASRKEQQKRYKFESTASDDEMEDELDENLDEISDMTKRLKALGTAMGQELDNQNSRIERIEGKTVGLDSRIFRNTERVSSAHDLDYFLVLNAFFLYSSRRSSNGDIDIGVGRRSQVKLGHGYGLGTHFCPRLHA